MSDKAQAPAKTRGEVTADHGNYRGMSVDEAREKRHHPETNAATKPQTEAKLKALVDRFNKQEISQNEYNLEIDKLRGEDASIDVYRSAPAPKSGADRVEDVKVHILPKEGKEGEPKGRVVPGIRSSGDDPNAPPEGEGVYVAHAKTIESSDMDANGARSEPGPPEQTVVNPVLPPDRNTQMLMDQEITAQEQADRAAGRPTKAEQDAKQAQAQAQGSDQGQNQGGRPAVPPGQDENPANRPATPPGQAPKPEPKKAEDEDDEEKAKAKHKGR
jgi:hypothetical protein